MMEGLTWQELASHLQTFTLRVYKYDHLVFQIFFFLKDGHHSQAQSFSSHIIEK